MDSIISWFSVGISDLIDFRRDFIVEIHISQIPI